MEHLFSCVATRALPFGIKIDVQNVLETDFSKKDIAGVLFQYPDTEGNICDFTRVVKEAKDNGVIFYPTNGQQIIDRLTRFEITIILVFMIFVKWKHKSWK